MKIIIYNIKLNIKLNIMMDDLININGICPLEIIKNHTIYIRDLTMYKLGKTPTIYVCNLEKIFSKLKENKIDIIYSKNRPADNKKIQEIILYQQSVGYDTSDWRLIGATINGRDFKIIDGGHRSLASLDLLDIIGEIHIWDFSSELERFEKFKIINISSDLPEIYKLSFDDMYKILIEKIIFSIDEKFFYIDKSLYTDGFITYAPFLEKETFKNFLFLKRYTIFGEFTNFIDNIDIEAEKFINKLTIINYEIVDKILFTGCGAAKFPTLSALIQNNNSICSAINKTTRKRCLNKSSFTYNGFCGYHKNNESPDYNKIIFIDITSIVKKFHIAIGLLSYDEILIYYNNKFNTLMD